MVMVRMRMITMKMRRRRRMMMMMLSSHSLLQVGPTPHGASITGQERVVAPRGVRPPNALHMTLQATKDLRIWQCVINRIWPR
jgi:hypothetical protein